MTDSEIADVILRHDETQAAHAAGDEFTIGRNILARTHRGERVAILADERVRFVSTRFWQSATVEVELMQRVGSPYCYLPLDALKPVGRGA